MAAETPAPLGPAEVRVLGSLVEKDITTHDYYPLTLNALTNACNQSSTRDPVVSDSEQEVTRALDVLRERRLAFVFQGAESRVAKFGHRLLETLELDRPGAALLCVLMLRGPQTAGEVRSRTGRMHDFESLADVEAALEALCTRPAGALAARLPRQRGMKEQRYAHLLGGPAEQAPPAQEGAGAQPAAALPGDERVARLEGEVEGMRREVADLRRELSELKGQLG
jgi:uncharacterized protein YceH (UPF0502 family)